MRIGSSSNKTALAVGAFALIIVGCGGPDFNPLPPGAVSPTPVSVSPTASASDDPTALPTSEPTPEAPFVIGNAAEYVVNSLRQLERRESMSIRSTVMLDAVGSAASEGSEVPGPGRFVRVEGDYDVSYIPLMMNGVETIRIPYPGLHLLFFEGLSKGEGSASGGAGATGPPDAELEAISGRFVTDTTGHNFKIHETREELLEDLYPGPRPGAGVFLSLALSGGRIVETNLVGWLFFAPDEVWQTGTASTGGSEVNVFRASRSRSNGDIDEWTFWIGDDGLLRRIELTMSNALNPARNIEHAELEFLN